MDRERFPQPVRSIAEIAQRDLSSASVDDQNAALAAFERRLEEWRDSLASADGGGPGLVSVEIPVFKAGWLIPCIESVLFQTSTCWTLTARWDGGDPFARRILEIVARFDHPRLRAYFGENRGIAYTRRFLTQHSSGDYILCLDDDDMLAPATVERFVATARVKPWSGIIRARREFIDESGATVSGDTWFPFEPRKFQRGMVTDLFNHSQPALISRAAYDRTTGWEGFPEFRSAGEDCDMFLKVEEVAPVELLDDVLYFYRLSDRRTSLVLTNEAAFEMWRRLADKAIERLGLPLVRTGDLPPYYYERAPRPRLAADQVDFIVPGEPDDAAVRLSVDALRRCGAAEDAVHVVAEAASPGATRNEGFRRSRRPVIAHVAAGVELSDAAALAALLSSMDDRDADVAGPALLPDRQGAPAAAPSFDDRGLPAFGGPASADPGGDRETVAAAWLPSRLLLLRREVARAVGGFDEAFLSSSYADADFCLKARRRDFRCLYVGGAAAFDREARALDAPAADVARLQGKWASAPCLLRRMTPSQMTGAV